MSAVVPPIYTFNIFNSAFFNGLNSNYLQSSCNYLLHKNVKDTATAPETFSSRIIIDSINTTGTTDFLIFPNNTIKTIQFGANITTGNTNIQTNGNINMGKTTATGSIQLKSRVSSSYPVSVVSAIAPATLKIGYITYRTSTKISTTATLAAGTYPIYSAATSIQFGWYLISGTATLTLPTFTAGSITNLEIGYSLGASGTASANPPFAQYVAVANTGISKSGDIVISFSTTISTITTQFVAFYITYTQTLLTGGTSQASIHNFSVVRLG